MAVKGSEVVILVKLWLGHRRTSGRSCPAFLKKSCRESKYFALLINLFSVSVCHFSSAEDEKWIVQSDLKAVIFICSENRISGA